MMMVNKTSIVQKYANIIDYFNIEIIDDSVKLYRTGFDTYSRVYLRIIHQLFADYCSWYYVSNLQFNKLTQIQMSSDYHYKLVLKIPNTYKHDNAQTNLKLTAMYNCRNKYTCKSESIQTIKTKHF